MLDFRSYCGQARPCHDRVLHALVWLLLINDGRMEQGKTNILHLLDLLYKITKILALCLCRLFAFKLFSHYEEDQATRKDVKICKLNCEEHKEFCAQIGVR